MALDKLTLLDETIINNTATSVATTVVNNSAQTNYIAFPVATANPLTNGWRVYKNTDTVAPTTGADGSANTTLTQNTSNPLNSTGDFRLTKSSGASRRGEGISTDFTISARHLGKVLQISFDYELVLGSLATDDIRVYIIQDPTSGSPVVIEPVNVAIQGSNTSSPTIKLRHLATFQTHISMTSYRLCIHVATSTNSNQTIDFNNFRVWETVQSIGSVVTDWISYTPSTTRANTTNRSFYYRRVGGGIQISFGWQYTSGVTGSSTALMTDIFPPGLTLDLSRIAPANASGNYLRYNVGYYFSNDYGSSNHTGTIVWDTNQDPDQLAFMGGSPNSADDNLSGFIECPIVGWGSSVAMSSDSGDGRAIEVILTGVTSQSITTSSGIVFNVKVRDTHNAINLSSGSGTTFTAPVSGLYNITGGGITLSGNNWLVARVNSTNLYAIGIAISNATGLSISGDVYLNSGDVLRIVGDGSGITAAGATYGVLSIKRISAGSQIIASSETVAMHVIKGSGSVGNGTAVTSWTATTLDTHRGFNLTLGEYTIPISGTYFFSGQTADNSGISGTASVRLQTNISGSFADITGTTNGMYNTSGSIYYAPHFTHIRRCIAGEKLRLYSNYAGGGSSGIWIDVWFNVARVGI